MKAKIAITDANIFIDLHNLELTKYFFALEIEVHTTSAVLYELYTEQQELLVYYQNIGRLYVHNLGECDFIEIHRDHYPRSLSGADKSVLHIAKKINASILSSDKTLRNCAKNKQIEYHGMIWIFDQLAESSSLPLNEIKAKLRELVASNFLFRNNPKLDEEIKKRLKIWK